MSEITCAAATFSAQTAGFDLATLESDTSCIYGLSQDLRLSYMNPAWYQFARENGGEALLRDYPVGADYMAAILEPLRSHYVDLYQGLLLSGSVWRHDYECSRSDWYRLYHQTVYPLRDRSGLLVVNSLRVEHAIDAGSAAEALAEAYTQSTELITGCVHCKRVLRAGDADTGHGWWDSVQGWTRKAPANMSHSLCPLCYDYFYKHRPPMRDPVDHQVCS